MPGFRIIGVSALLLGLTGCSQSHRSGGDARAIRPDVVGPLVVADGKGLLLSFYDNRAEMRTVESIEQVALTARSDVMITDSGRHLTGDRIYVSDLRKKGPDHRYRVWVEARGIWLDRVVPKQSVLRALARNDQPKAVASRAPDPVKPRIRRRPHRRRRPKPPVGPDATQQVPQAEAKNQIILFSTTWCPSCKTARAYLLQKGVKFQELDVERDPRAGQFYHAVQQRFRLKPGVIPVIIIGQQVFQGFSRPQVDAALAAMGPA